MNTTAFTAPAATGHSEYIAWQEPNGTWTIGFYEFENAYAEPTENFSFTSSGHASLKALREEYTLAEGPLSAHLYGALRPERRAELNEMARACLAHLRQG